MNYLNKSEVAKVVEAVNEYMRKHDFDEGTHEISVDVTLDNLEVAVELTYEIEETYYRAETRLDPAEYGYRHTLTVDSITAYTPLGFECGVSNAEDIQDQLEYSDED